MKNYEKYAEEIKNYDGVNFCSDFVIPVIRKGCECSKSCEQCRMLQNIWLREDYEEPKVDWGKVKVDTPVLVRDSENTEWLKKYFAKYEDGIVYVWNLGRTSWTAPHNKSVSAWKYAKLAEDEKESEVDWSKVKVDTAIYVKASKYGNWFKRYFAEYKNGKIYTWGNGLTSHDTSRMMEWNYAKLAKSERKDNISESNANN